MPPCTITHMSGLESQEQSLAANRKGHRKLHLNKSWAHFVAGGYANFTFSGQAQLKPPCRIGGMTAALVTSPLDVLKTRLQSDFYRSQSGAALASSRAQVPYAAPFLRSSLISFRETFQVLFSIHRIEGWRALFKGLGPTLTGVIPSSAIKFYAYGNSKSFISRTMNNGQEAAWVHLLSAAAAGVVVSTATNPIWLIKTRLQLDKSGAEEAGLVATKRYGNSFDCARQVLRHEGIKGFYRGLSASYLGIAESSLQWVLYEQMKLRLARQEQSIGRAGKPLTPWEETIHLGWKIGAAGSAKLVAAGVTYPHEVRDFRYFFELFLSTHNDSR